MPDAELVICALPLQPIEQVSGVGFGFSLASLGYRTEPLDPYVIDVASFLWRMMPDTAFPLARQNLRAFDVPIPDGRICSVPPGIC